MSTENETQTAAPRTAAALIQEAARVVNWRPDDKHPMQARYDAARAMASMYAYWTVVSLETLRRINPALAEAVTTHIDNDLDWPNAHEHAYGWEQTLAAGKPIPADAWPFGEISGQPATQAAAPPAADDTSTWCVHVQGPDDVLPAADRHDAMRKAHELNAAMVDHIQHETPELAAYYPTCWAVPMERKQVNAGRIW